MKFKFNVLCSVFYLENLEKRGLGQAASERGSSIN